MARKKKSTPKPRPPSKAAIAKAAKARVRKNLAARSSRAIKSASAKYKLRKGESANFATRANAIAESFKKKYLRARSDDRRKELEKDFKYLLKMLAKKEREGKDALANWQYKRLNKIMADLVDMNEDVTYTWLYGS